MKMFTPSSTDLTNMIKAAEAKFDQAREDAKYLRAQVNEAKAISHRRRWGSIDSRGRICE